MSPSADVATNGISVDTYDLNKKPESNGATNLDGHRAAGNGFPTNGCDTNGHSINGTGGTYSPMMPIAICGMACRLPGGLSSPEELWDFVLAKKNARGRVPESRYNISAYYSATPKPGAISTEYGHFLDDSVDLGALDTSFFTLPRTEVERADPQQRLMLEVSRECFEDAGVTNWRGKTIGCYIGNFGEDWNEMFVKEPQQWGMHRIVGTGDFVISNRLSYEFDIKGPSMTIRTACSASLVALNEACLALARGDCEAALVGGINLILGPNMTMAMTEQGILSKDGCCKSFSADANGYARGEAATAIFVKPLADALRDGNPVRAIIRATSHNVDGKTPGISQPSTDAQEALIRRAYQLAGIKDYSQTAMVECHGTGTPIGDPIEAKAVARVFGEKGVYIGSIKPNLGHCEGASGFVSLIKMVKALENRTIPPNIRFNIPNPNIPFKEARLVVPIEPTPWPEDRLERISLNSFGVGGANAHVILESAASAGISTATNGTREPPHESHQLLIYTANSTNSLTRMIDIYKEWVENNPTKISDLAYTLAIRREHLPHRTFAIVKNGQIESVSPPVNTKNTKDAEVVMVFTGQGAQWPQMGRELMQSNQTFRSSIQSLDQYLHAMATGKPPYSIEEELKKPAKTSGISLAEFSQPLCTAIQIALVDTLKSLSIEPSAVVGHSSGEIAAAYASGALTAREAIITAHYRGAVTTKQKRAGSMAAVGMGWEATKEHLVDRVTVACDNSPQSVTVSGDTDQVKHVIANIKKAHPDVMARLLQVDKAYHSYHMAEIGEEYISMIEQYVTGANPSIPFFSSVTGGLLDKNSILGPNYWRDNLEQTVRFREAVTNIVKHDVSNNAIFLEVGPHSALGGPLRQIFTEASSPFPYVSAMARGQSCTASLLNAIGKLYSHSVNVDLDVLFPTGKCLPDLPRYPWNHEESYWYESRICKEWRHRKYPYHDLLGIKLPESTEIEPMWRNIFHITNVPWVRDHRVGEDIVFPFAGYIALAGEAIRQLTEIEDGFSIRNIKVTMALVLSEGKPTEMLTSFRPHRLTDSLNSPWWEFTVTSYNGHTWNKHCTGEITVLSSNLGPGRSPDPLPRKINAKRYYGNMSKGGLDLGPCFQTLEDIETSTGSENRATAKVINGRQGDESNYHIHPTVIDGTIQILGAAAVNGLMRKTRNWLPTSIDKISIWRCSSDMTTDVSAELSSNYSVVGRGNCVSEGITVIEASGLRMSLANGALSNEIADTHSAARYEWDYDIDFMNANELIGASVEHADQLHLLEELWQLCLLIPIRSHSRVPTLPLHLEWYFNWIQSESEALANSPKYQPMSPENKLVSTRIEHLLSNLSSTPAASAATTIYQVCQNMDALLSGQSLTEILPEETLTNVYKFIDQLDISRLVQRLGHCLPNLQILEIGNGRDSIANSTIESLTRADGRILCSKYTLTSTGFISGKDQQDLFPNMEYVTLDISEDLSEQGFEDRQYDLIIARNVLHTSKSLQNSLANVKKLLRPDGRFLLQELCPSSKWMNYIFGVLPTWWSGTVDGRLQEPYISIEKWKSELALAGLEVPEAPILDALEPHQLTAIMIVRHASLANAEVKRITVLCEEQEPVTEEILSQLAEEGYDITMCNLGDTPPAHQDVISLLDVDKPFFDSFDEAQFQLFKTFLHGIQDAGILWVTKTIQIGCQDPRYGQILGLARVVRSEMLTDFATCEVEDLHHPDTAKNIVKILRKFQTREDGSTMNPDFEWTIKNDRIQVGRFYPFSLRDELLTSDPTEIARLDVKTPGRVNSLHWLRQPREELKANEVEVQVHSAGLNFRDVLVALGVVELPIRQFGLEAAGIITRVGAEVDPNELAIGDRVFCLKKQAYSTYITTPTTFCIPIPDHLSFDEAASMLMPYVTAIHGLVNVGRLSKGQTVLVHSACGGVGLAAVQISQMIGADLYVTVGNDEKVNFLMENYHIPRSKIFNSRDKSFVDDVMRETGGQGIDVVLNSLSGELLHATWGCVAEFGTLVEIGKRDLVGGGKLDMTPFLANRSYCCIDIDQLWKKPVLLRNLIISTLQYYVEGKTTPVRPVKVFPASQTQDAFRYMQKGQHIGRIGISIPHLPNERDISFETTKQAQEIIFDKAAASYLLVGGLGGLGRAISIWMVEHGARELLYLARSATPSPTNHAFVEELQSMGCNVKLAQGDVTNKQDVERAVAAATYPLKGIIQMSMVLRDQNFTEMTFEEWTAASAPKVKGTWNLHEVTTAVGANLDFMVLFSSLSGIIGQPGQANYASGNTFLDAFAQYRNDLGLPASVVDIGAVEDVGFISENNALMNKMKTSGFLGIAEQELLDAMAVAMLARSRPPPANGLDDAGSRFVHENTFVLGLGSSIPLTSPANRAVWKRDRRMAAYHNEVAGGADVAASNETLKAYLSMAKANPSVLKSPETAKLFALEIGKKLFDLLLKPQEELNPSWPLVDLGLDSLVALELRAWWKQVFSFDITVMEMLGMGSLEALGQHAADETLRIVTENASQNVS
ncbi:putative polyketide synthase [Hypoxylon trugodes]|uniref:putative polyketide synthase n=1 Tax=Hypoxylon trugodes TaxID=326681 RepID=UPI002196E294|nr:putative polyketide synthase [Hypoxylon trugodes]KAI1388535.1 putative polyketide synthase [Hypoxylon trugodes]